MLFKNQTLVQNYDYRGTRKSYFDNLSARELLDILFELNQTINTRDEFVSSYLVPSNWTGTVFEPIYHAAGDNVEEAGKMFGVIVKFAVQISPLVFDQVSITVGGDNHESSQYVRR